MRIRAAAWVWIVGLVGPLLLGLACSAGPEGEGEADDRHEAPAFTLDRLDGEPVSLSDWLGKPVVLDFWATWCPPCEFQVPELNALYESHREAGDVGVFGISIDEGEASEVKAWMTEKGVRYPVLLGDDGLAREYGALGFPTFVLIAPDGKIEWTHAGVIEHADIAERLKKLLARQWGSPGPRSPVPGESGDKERAL